MCFSSVDTVFIHSVILVHTESRVVFLFIILYPDPALAHTKTGGKEVIDVTKLILVNPVVVQSSEW